MLIFDNALLRQSRVQGGRGMIYSHIIRVRPDSFFASPLPPLSSFLVSAVSTWAKFDAIGSDQFFIMPTTLYRTWWLAYVVPLVNKGEIRKAAEYSLFRTDLVKTNQEYNIKGCLLRCANKIECWRTGANSYLAKIFPKRRWADDGSTTKMEAALQACVAPPCRDPSDCLVADTEVCSYVGIFCDCNNDCRCMRANELSTGVRF